MINMNWFYHLWPCQGNDTDLNGSLTLNHSGYNKLYQTNVSENVLINDISYKSTDNISKTGIVSNYVFFKKFQHWLK